MFGIFQNIKPSVKMIHKEVRISKIHEKKILVKNDVFTVRLAKVSDFLWQKKKKKNSNFLKDFFT